jgi:uncharacterized protein (DUF1697 family)
MTTFIALLRAVNVGGTGKITMADLKAICEAADCRAVRTYIASGNVVFESTRSEKAIQKALQERLLANTGKLVGIVIRTAEEMAEVLTRNPFPSSAGNRTVAIFLDAAPASDALTGATGCVDEEMALGRREIYVSYGPNMGRSKLRIPAAKTGTARNMNTVAKLAAMGREAAKR